MIFFFLCRHINCDHSIFLIFQQKQFHNFRPIPPERNGTNSKYITHAMHRKNMKRKTTKFLFISYYYEISISHSFDRFFCFFLRVHSLDWVLINEFARQMCSNNSVLWFLSTSTSSNNIIN